MEILITITPYIAWFVCIALLAIPGLWGIVFLFTLLGHLTQFVVKKESLRINRVNSLPEP